MALRQGIGFRVVVGMCLVELLLFTCRLFAEKQKDIFDVFQSLCMTVCVNLKLKKDKCSFGRELFVLLS